MNIKLSIDVDVWESFSVVSCCALISFNVSDKHRI